MCLVFSSLLLRHWAPSTWHDLRRTRRCRCGPVLLPMSRGHEMGRVWGYSHSFSVSRGKCEVLLSQRMLHEPMSPHLSSLALGLYFPLVSSQMPTFCDSPCLTVPDMPHCFAYQELLLVGSRIYCPFLSSFSSAEVGIVWGQIFCLFSFLLSSHRTTWCTNRLKWSFTEWVNESVKSEVGEVGI